MRKRFYRFSVRELWKEAGQPVDQGGINLFGDENGVFNLSMSSFQKCLPFNLSQMTNSNRVMLGCQTCVDANQIMMSVREWRNRNYGRLKEAVVRLKNVADNNPDDDEAKAACESSVKSRDTHQCETHTDETCIAQRQKEANRGHRDGHDMPSSVGRSR